MCRRCRPFGHISSLSSDPPYDCQVLLGRERYDINTTKSAEVVLNDDIKSPEEGNLLYGTGRIARSGSEVHLGIDRNSAAIVDVEARVQTGRRTMYAVMGASAYGCSGVTAPLTAHIRRVYALPRMTYGLEDFTLNSKAIHLMEKMQRSIIR